MNYKVSRSGEKVYIYSESQSNLLTAEDAREFALSVLEQARCLDGRSDEPPGLTIATTALLREVSNHGWTSEARFDVLKVDDQPGHGSPMVLPVGDVATLRALGALLGGTVFGATIKLTKRPEWNSRDPLGSVLKREAEKRGRAPSTGAVHFEHHNTALCGTRAMDELAKNRGEVTCVECVRLYNASMITEGGIDGRK